MRITFSAPDRNLEVIAESFEIDGSDEKFAVHPALPGDEHRGRFVATHIDTGYAIGRAATIDGAIKAGCKAWVAASPQKIIDAKARAAAALRARGIQ